jgi:hypothetical protein
MQAQVVNNPTHGNHPRCLSMKWLGVFLFSTMMLLLVFTVK